MGVVLRLVALFACCVTGFLCGDAEVHPPDFKESNKESTFLLHQIKFLEEELKTYQEHSARQMEILNKKVAEHNQIMQQVEDRHAKLLDDIEIMNTELSHEIKALKVDNMKLRNDLSALTFKGDDVDGHEKQISTTKLHSSATQINMNNNTHDKSAESPLQHDLDVLSPSEKENRQQKRSTEKDVFPLAKLQAHVESKLMDFEQFINDFKKEQQQNTFVSFTAYPSVARDYTAGDKVLFDEVLYNYGAFYNKNDSTFTCPITAYYLFTVTARATGVYMHATIHLDDEPLVTAFADANSSHDQGSNTVVMLCEVGQVVAVYCLYDGNNRMHGPNRDSAFSGVLLRIA